MIINKSLTDRFWSKVAVNGVDDCWHWIGGISSSGYGSFRVNGKQMVASRVSYVINFGVLDERIYVLHKCDNPKCVNPKHLFTGTAKDNTIDMISKGRNINSVIASLGNSYGSLNKGKSKSEDHKKKISESMKKTKKLIREGLWDNNCN